MNASDSLRKIMIHKYLWYFTGKYFLPLYNRFIMYIILIMISVYCLYIKEVERRM